MEDPVKQIPELIAAILQNDDPKLQESTVLRYFSESAILDHPIAYCKRAREMVAAHQVWAMSNYSFRFTIHQLVYDEKQDFVIVRMTQYVRKWWNVFSEKRMPMVIFFQLEDEPERRRWEDPSQTVNGNGTRRKRIVLQHDYHSLEPIPVNLPIIGELYSKSFGLRSLTTMICCVTVKALKATVGTETIVHLGKSAYQFLGIK